MTIPKSNAPAPPQGLADLQIDFGKAIATPFLFEDINSGDYRLQMEHYPADIVNKMVAQPERDLSGMARLGTYNRQYWFRLLTVMQEEHPLMVALMGLLPFNQMVVAYLQAHPPQTHTLRDLSNQLTGFLETDESWGLVPLQQAARLEQHFIDAFDASEYERLDPSQLDEAAQLQLTQEPLNFQPHWRLFNEDWNLVHWHELAKSAKDTSDLEVDLQETPGFWALYRNGRVVVEQLGPLQFLLLGLLKNGTTLSAALSEVAEDLDEQTLTFLHQNVGSWFARWMALGWFIRVEH